MPRILTFVISRLFNRRAGILTGYPSATPFGYTLGPPNPSLIAIGKETLDFRRSDISSDLWLLMPTFSLLNAPLFFTKKLQRIKNAPLPLRAPRAHQRIYESVANLRIRIFVMNSLFVDSVRSTKPLSSVSSLSPDKSSAHLFLLAPRYRSSLLTRKIRINSNVPNITREVLFSDLFG